MRDYKPLIDAGMPRDYNNLFVVLTLASIVFSALGGFFSALTDKPRTSVLFWLCAGLGIACSVVAMRIAILAKRFSVKREKELAQHREFDTRPDEHEQ